MFSIKDYSKMTLDELVSEEKKLKSKKIPYALLMGFLVGTAIWSATHQGVFYVTLGLLISPVVIGSRYSENRKNIQAEIRSRNTSR